MRPVLGLAAVIVALCAAGCGGSTTLTHQAVVTRADKACGQADTAISRLGTPTASVTALTRYARKVLPISKQLVQRLAALKPDSASQKALNGLIGALRSGNQGLAQLESAASPAQVSAASRLISAKSVPSAAKALGASTCAAAPTA